jgi:hypothetical protein
MWQIGKAGNVTVRRIDMNNVTIIGIDLAKRVFHAHGARADGSVAFRKRLTRAQFLPFLSAQPSCIVAMEACASAHDWGRAIGGLGHDVRLIPPTYVKPYVKRQKNEATTWSNVKDGATRHPQAADHWRYGCHPMGLAPRSTNWILVAQNDRTEAHYARRNGAGEQDGTLDLGHVDEE